MAKGDTKTNQYLDIAANGTRADLPTDTCCETRSQTLIREVAERIIGVEEEVEDLKNNPDVVDIVDTYADLEDYDTSGLTDKDIIRVIADETKGGLSSYYRWNSPNAGWNFVGVIPGGDGIKELSSADYNYPENNPSGIALWLLDEGLYYRANDITTFYSSSQTLGSRQNYIIISRSQGTTSVSITIIGDAGSAYSGLYDLLTQYSVSSGGGLVSTNVAMTNRNVAQSTGTSTTDVMSQKATTDMVFLPNVLHDRQSIRIGEFATASTDGNSIGILGQADYLAVAIGGEASSFGAVALGLESRATADGAVALGRFSTATTKGVVGVGTTNTSYGYNTSNYRLITGVYDGQSAHDAATYGQLDTRMGGMSIVSISQADYDALATKDPDTLYVITGA